MGEADGKMLFVPARLEIKKGEQIKFVLRNNGELEHEFVLASTADNLKHAEAMQKHPDMAHEEPNGKAARAEEDRRDGLEIHQGRRVRICLPDPGSPRGGNDRNDRRQVMSFRQSGPFGWDQRNGSVGRNRRTTAYFGRGGIASLAISAANSRVSSRCRNRDQRSRRPRPTAAYNARYFHGG